MGRTLGIVLLLGFVLGTSVLTLAQAQSDRSSAFEVVSVKPNTSSDYRGSEIRFVRGGRFTARNTLLLYVITEAYDLPFLTTRLTGVPEWVHQERFDIEAVAAMGAISESALSQDRDGTLRRMVQTLLADRFKLKVRREMKQSPVYALVVTKNGIKFQRSTISEKDCTVTSWGFSTPQGGVSCHTLTGGQTSPLRGEAINMSDLARYAETFAERPVVDRTNIQGLFRIETTGWRPDLSNVRSINENPERAAATASLPTFFGVFDQLGLKLEPANASVEVLMINHVERPTPD